MRWVQRTIQFVLFGLILFGAALSDASITLKISASNPSLSYERTVPIKSYLPKGIRPENVIDAAGLEIGYDVKRDQCYVHKTVTLEAKASEIYNIEIDDIWLIEEEELNVLDSRAEEAVEELKDTQYAEIAFQVQEDIRNKISDIRMTQEEALIFKVGPTEHVAVYGSNREAFDSVQRSIDDLRRMQSTVKKGKIKGVSEQTQAARLIQAQRIKKQILNYGSDEKVSCLVQQSLKEEKEAISLESPETVLMKITVENQLTAGRQTVPLRYMLAKEVLARDIIDSNGLEIGFDFDKNLYYVYSDTLVLEPDEIKEFNIVLNNKWVVDKKKLYGLKVYLESLKRVADEEEPYLESAQKLGQRTLTDIYDLLKKDEAAEFAENRVISYRSDLDKVESMKVAVQSMEDFLIEGRISPELKVMDQEFFCQNAMLVETAENPLGLSGILKARRIKLLAGTIFKGKNLSTADTMKIIYYIIVFLGIISGVFYFVNIRQQKSTMFDPLTGAFARGYALERFREELKIAKGGDQKCSLLVMDIDKFKGINDTHGHIVGDTILKEFVIAMRKGVRATDLVGRFGGDEFIIILPTSEKEKSHKIAESIVRIIEGTAIRISPQVTLNITTSIGVATFPDDSGTAEDLFDKADQALYQVKKRGGNGAEAFGGGA